MPRKTSDKLATAQNEQEDALQMTEGNDFTESELLFLPEAEASDMSDDVADFTAEATEPIEMPHTLEAPEASPQDQTLEESAPEEPPADEPSPEAQLDLPKQATPQSDEKPATKAEKAAKPKATKAKAEKTGKPSKAPKEAISEKPQKPKNARQAFYSLDFRALDRYLSPEQEQEWNAIYASFRSQSILTGTVIGVDDHTFDITGENGRTERKTVRSLIIIGYRVKVMIPETEVWAVGEENPRYAIRGMVGAKVDYVIMRVDRENDCAIASRRMALTKKRRHTLQTSRGGQSELVACDTLMVSRKAALVNFGGFDLVLTQKDLRYTAIADLREEYKPGMELLARLLDIREGKPVVSVKEVNPNPFDGAEVRHPPGSRRQAMIEGKYGGGVFCRMPDNTTCLCLYSNNHYDASFEIGDTVLVYITEFDYGRKLIYGRIVAKR